LNHSSISGSSQTITQPFCASFNKNTHQLVRVLSILNLHINLDSSPSFALKKQVFISSSYPAHNHQIVSVFAQRLAQDVYTPLEKCPDFLSGEDREYTSSMKRHPRQSVMTCFVLSRFDPNTRRPDRFRETF
jgi:hypothetical protein